MNQLQSVLSSVLASVLFVFVLHIYPIKLSRNDPFTIKVRFCGVCLSILFSLYILNLYEIYVLSELQICYLFTRHFLINGIFKPIFILLVIQLVPIFISARSLIEDFDVHEFNIISLRDTILAPVTEELTYRYILLKLLYPCFSELNSCLISSFLFGLSHFHYYLINLIPESECSLIATCYQFVFTFLFGLFASSIYFKSTYIIAPIICHSICNYLCLPDFERILSSRILSLLTICTVGLGLYLMVVL